MSSLALSLLLFSLIFLAHVQYSECVKETYDKTSASQYGAYVQKDFGMAIGGYIQLQYSVSAQNSSLPYDSYILLLIINGKQRDNYYSTLEQSESDIVAAMPSLCNYPSVLRIAAPVGQQDQVTLDITQSLGGSDLYSVVILQCRSGVESNPVTVSIKADMLNIRPSGDGVSHLSIEDVNMTRIYQGLIIMYSLMLLGLIGQFYYGSRGDRSFVLPIHKFFLVTLCFKLILICLLYYGK
ncbi:hypothetical protein EON65_00045 [archaeon]|nr:MAG: hypothetical protein EON65_00045 [archaeon]